MDTERDDWLDRLFARAKDLSPEDQQRIVEAECDETAIRVEVLELLKAYCDAPKQDFAHRILPNDAVVRSYEAVESDATVTNDALVREGQVIGPYKVLQVLGEGGMGTVYMAEQNEPIARRVAIKLIKPGMGCKEILARFEAERQALSMMDHPNIARVLDAGSDSGRSYFVMELVKGLPITEYCDLHRLPMKGRLELFGSVCRGVAHAHQKGIIHRDIKPSNVLIAEYDDDVVPKIIDFGVAKATTQKLTERTLFTRYGQLVGTVDYMSPEQAKLNQLDIDTRSDVYSLGVLLYELLVGMTPFDRQRLRSAALHEMLRIISEEEPPRLSRRFTTTDSSAEIAARRNIQPEELSHMLRGELDWIVTRSLEKDRTNRYQSVSELADDIQRHLSGEAVAACPPTLRYRMGKFVKRYKVAVVVTCLVILLLSISSAVGWSLYREAEVAREAESEARTDAESAKFAAEQRKQEAESRLKLARVSRLAAESRAIADEDPSIAALLAIEAFESCEPTEEAAYSLTHAALLNTTQHLSQMGRPIKFDAAPISRLQFVGDYLVAECEQDVRLWRYTSPDPVGSCQIIGGPSNPTRLIDASSDGQRLLTASQNVEVWDLAGGPAKAKVVVRGEVTVSDLSPDGHWLVAAIPAPNERVRVLQYDLRRADVTQRLIGEYPSDSLKSLLVSAHGKWIAVNEKNSRTLDLFEVNEKNAKVKRLQLATSASEVLLSPNGRWLATAHEDDPNAVHADVTHQPVAIRVWDLWRPDIDEPFRTMATGSGRLFFGPNSQRLFVRGNASGELISWDLTGEEDPVLMKNIYGDDQGTTLSADGRWLLRGSCTGWASLVDVHQGRSEDVRTYSLGLIISVIDASGRWVATTFKDGGIRIKDLHRMGDESIVMKGKEGPLFAPVAVSRTGRWIATITSDDEVQLRDTRAEVVEDAGLLLPEASKLVGFSADEHYFVASGPDKTVSVWDLAADNVNGSRRPFGRGEATITADSRWLITGGDPGRRCEHLGPAVAEFQCRKSSALWPHRSHRQPSC